MTVASATPRTPSFGAPNSPKMNTAFSTTFVSTVMAEMTVLLRACSTERSVH